MQIIRKFWSWWLDTFKKQSGVGKLIFGIISLCIVCFICGLPISVLSPRQTPTPETVAESELPTDTPVPTDTPTIEPTNTPQPTATPVPPTDTPTIEPTNTSVPSTNTPTREPTNTPIPPTNTPEPTDEPVLVSDNGNGYLSGGLGLSKADWDSSHTETNLDYQPFGTGYDNIYDVAFQIGNVWYIDRQWDTNNFVTLDVAEIVGQSLIPADSQLVETYSPEGIPEIIVNLYFSESLKSRFRNEDETLFGNWWFGGEPGNFIVSYSVYDGEVARMVIGIGNNP